MSMKFLLKRNGDKWDIQGEAEGKDLEVLFNPHPLSVIFPFLATKAQDHDTIRIEFEKDGEEETEEEDFCSLCGLPGADKFPHPEHWPGETVPDSELVHAECEEIECKRAHAALSDEERRAVLKSIQQRGAP